MTGRCRWSPESVVGMFAKNVRAERKRQGLTQYELAAAAGTAHGTVYGIENALNAPSLPVAFCLARALGCTISDLTGEST